MRFIKTTGIAAAIALSTISLTALCAYAQVATGDGVYAIVGARIEVGGGKVIEKGTVVLRDGTIVDVGPDVKPPADAEIIKGDGLTVYPGFINAYTVKGLTLPDPVPNQDTVPDISATASPTMRIANRKGVRPELHAADLLSLTDEILKPERQAGFTTDLISPGGGTINGVGALVNLTGLPRRDSVVLPGVLMDFAFGTNGSGYPGSAMGIIALTRQTLLDAQYYMQVRTAFEHGSTVRPPDDPVLSALQTVVAGSMPVLYSANTEREIRRAINIADEFKLQLWINGGVEAYKASPLLASRHIPVVLSLNFGQEPGVTPTPTPGGGGGAAGGRPGGGGGGGRRNRPATTPGDVPPAGAPPAGAAPPSVQPPVTTTPRSIAPGIPEAPPVEDTTPRQVIAERHVKWEEKVANAAQLNKAGVTLVLSTTGVRNQAEFLTNLRKAIKAGLPRQAALDALTINAAKLFKVDRQLGSVVRGKTAALVVMNGDFVDEKTTVQYLFIDKSKFEPGRDTGPIIAAPARRRPADADDAP